MRRLRCCWLLLAFLCSFSTIISPANGAPQQQQLNEKTKALPITRLVSAEDEAFHREVKSGKYQKIGTVLGRMAYYVEKGYGTEKDLSTKINSWYKILPQAGGVQVEVIFQISPARSHSGLLMKHAHAMGFTSKACIKNVCEGYIHIDHLVEVSQDPMIQFIRPFVRPITKATASVDARDRAADPGTSSGTVTNINNKPGTARVSQARSSSINRAGGGIDKTGSVTSEGDPAMGSDIARGKYGLTGAGIKLGLLSDSFDCSPEASTNYADDIATGDLPDNVEVLEELTPPCTDEGRAMLQIIHDVAPGAELIFHTAFSSAIVFAQGIQALADAGANVIVDDVGYANQPFFQDGLIAQAADAVFAQGIPYFSAAGNSARRAWHTEDGFVDSGEVFNGSPLHNFGTADEVDVVQGVELIEGVEYFFIFQWDQPFASVPGSVGCESDVDFGLTDPDLNLVAQAADDNLGGDAWEGIIYTPTVSGVHGISIILYEGPAPGYIKWQVFRGGEVPAEYPILSSTSYGHPNAAGAAGIGAAEWINTPRFFADPAIQEPFSSAGGTPIIFDTSGTRLDSFEIREQPRVTGPDGGITTFFGEENRFFGTSAAAPHVAAVVTLMLEAKSDLTPSEIYTIIQNAAQDMNDTATPEFDIGYDTGTGYGFFDAEAALDLVLSGTIAPTAFETPAPTFAETTEPSFGTSAPTSFTTSAPTPTETTEPTAFGTTGPTVFTTTGPTFAGITDAPSAPPSNEPTFIRIPPPREPTIAPLETDEPTIAPPETDEPTEEPTSEPTEEPTSKPTPRPGPRPTPPPTPPRTGVASLQIPLFGDPFFALEYP